MKFKHIHFIVNPASGKEEPILSYINTAMSVAGIDWDISVTKKGLSAAAIARKVGGHTNLIAVYGGDGCVTEVAAALYGTDVPMAIIPGGTANVMAKELGISLESMEALALLANGKHRIKKIDMGLVNGRPFVLRVNLGIMADMITNADRDLKDSIGQLAYGITAVQTVAQAQPVDYELLIDGKKIKTSGVSLTVTNSGNMGMGDMALQPGISITDGLLDVIVMKDAGIISLLKVAGSALLQNQTEAVQHWKVKKVEVKMAKQQVIICDDAALKAKKLKIEVVPGSIRMLIPK